jgi:hypothetical protein
MFDVLTHETWMLTIKKLSGNDLGPCRKPSPLHDIRIPGSQTGAKMKVSLQISFLAASRTPAFTPRVKIVFNHKSRDEVAEDQPW